MTPWYERFPVEERDEHQIMGRVLAQSGVDLTDDAGCLLVLMNARWRAREASGYLREAQRYALAFRATGRAA